MSLRCDRFLVNFYGYTDLEFIKEPRKLLKQAISAKEIATIDQTKPVWDDPFLSRYLLYHYSIQQELLPHFYGLPENGDWSAYALSDTGGNQCGKRNQTLSKITKRSEISRFFLLCLSFLQPAIQLLK